MLIRYAETLYHSGLQRCRENDCILYRVGCKEFVNADEIAKGLSPFNPESVAIEAGRLMLQRMDDLLAEGADFAFETTLATPFLCEIYRTGTRERLLCNPTLFLAADS